MRLLVGVALAGAVACSAAAAQEGACGELWLARNRVYAAAGYCFKTARAIRAFGNAGCRFDDERDVPLSLRERREVDRLTNEEAALGCRD